VLCFKYFILTIFSIKQQWYKQPL